MDIGVVIGWKKGWYFFGIGYLNYDVGMNVGFIINV